MNRYVGATPGAREAARIAWRADVSEAASDWNGCPCAACRADLDLQLSAPRPWRSSRRPTPRRRYSREHRRGCERCRAVLRAVRRNEPRTYTWTWERVADVPGCRKLNIVTVYVRDPHGRGGA
jgi:hypothetical protein